MTSHIVPSWRHPWLSKLGTRSHIRLQSLCGTACQSFAWQNATSKPLPEAGLTLQKQRPRNAANQNNKARAQSPDSNFPNPRDFCNSFPNSNLSPKRPSAMYLTKWLAVFDSRILHRFQHWLGERGNSMRNHCRLRHHSHHGQCHEHPECINDQSTESAP